MAPTLFFNPESINPAASSARRRTIPRQRQQLPQRLQIKLMAVFSFQKNDNVRNLVKKQESGEAKKLLDLFYLFATQKDKTAKEVWKKERRFGGEGKTFP